MDKQFYFFNSSFNPLEPLYVYQYGYEQCSSGHYFGPAKRDYYLIHYIMSGEGIFLSGGKEYRLNRNQAFVITPGVTTYYRADQTSPWLYYWIGFGGTDAARIMGQFDFSKNSPIITVDPEQTIKRSFLSLVHECKIRGFSNSLALSWLYRVFYGITAGSALPHSHTSDHLGSAVKFIADNYSDDITVEDISRHVHLDRSYLYKLFIRELSVSPVNYLINYRITQSANLLTHTGHSVTDVALMCGFKSTALFCRVFKKLTGKTPLNYRKQSMSGNGFVLQPPADSAPLSKNFCR